MNCENRAIDMVNLHKNAIKLKKKQFLKKIKVINTSIRIYGTKVLKV